MTWITCPTAQLRHTLPDGTWHVDWLIGRDLRGESALITFRLPAPLADLTPGAALDAERLADHRPHYLTYEGPVDGTDGTPGARGSVTRLAQGLVRHDPTLLESGETGDVTLEVCWVTDDAPPVMQRLVLSHDAQTRWRVSCAPDA